MSRLLTGFGVPHSVIGKIVATPPANIAFLNSRELAGLNVRRSNLFRNQSAGLARQEATSACDPRANFETEVLAAVGKQSCTTSADNRDNKQHAPNSRFDCATDLNSR